MKYKCHFCEHIAEKEPDCFYFTDIAKPVEQIVKKNYKTIYKYMESKRDHLGNPFYNFKFGS